MSCKRRQLTLSGSAPNGSFHSAEELPAPSEARGCRKSLFREKEVRC